MLRMIPKERGKDLATLIVFLILGLLLLVRHEPWRDEAQAWLVARDAPSVGSIINLMGYEGTPSLWYLLLVPFARLDFPYATMSILHFAIAFSAVTIFLWFAPLPRALRTIAVFGYFLFFEYAVLARTYALSVLLLFVLATIDRKRFTRPIIYATLLLLLANTNVHSLVLSGVLGGMFLVEGFRFRRFRSVRVGLISTLIVTVGLLVSIAQILPPADLSFDRSAWDVQLSVDHLRILPQAVVEGFVAVPLFQFQSGVGGVENAIPDWLKNFLTLSGIPLFMFLLFVLRRGRAMETFLFGSLGLFAIFFFRYAGSLRHHGLLLILFLYSLWIASSSTTGEQAPTEGVDSTTSLVHSPTGAGPRRWVWSTICILLLPSVLSAAVIFSLDWRYDFSASRSAAKYLVKNGFLEDKTFVLSYPSAAASAILPYLPRSRAHFYYLEYNAMGSYMTLNAQYFSAGNLSNDQVLERIDAATQNRQWTRIVFITNHRFADVGAFSNRFQLLRAFEQSIVGTDALFIYEQFASPQTSSSGRMDSEEPTSRNDYSEERKSV